MMLEFIGIERNIDNVVGIEVMFDKRLRYERTERVKNRGPRTEL